MAFNKAKAMESALKSLNQGKVAQAIQEYQQILRGDPNDQVVLMTVGDLFVRQGNMSQAVEYFERLAQLYLNDGFNSKAIAIYKKISKIAPAETQPLEKLANLYVQQGVLSEARPIFLQLAEARLKAKQTGKAVEVLRRLLEVEPDNPRVQRRLAELYIAMGQKKEAAQTYLRFASYLSEHGEQAEAIKMAEAALVAEPGNSEALTLKAQLQGAAGDTNAAIATLSKLSDSDTGADALEMQVDLCLKTGQSDRAVELVQHAALQDSTKNAFVLRVANSLSESGEADKALSLVAGIRKSAAAGSEKENLAKLLSVMAERMPGRTEPLEWAADLYRQTGDTYHLSETQTQLADVLTNAREFPRAEAILKELLEHEPGNDIARQRLSQLHIEMSRQAAAPAEPIGPVVDLGARESFLGPEAPARAPTANEAGLDDDTQRFISQALTDVDLFSSYGLTQKAIQLLDTILQRVPQHAPTLERLLDLALGEGDEHRTAELAAQLEQIYTQRGDMVNAERFTELRRRFLRAAGVPEHKIAPAPAPPARPTAGEATSPPEFSIPAAPSEAQIPVAGNKEAEEPAAVASSAAPAEGEIDLSEEWASLAAETTTPPPPPPPKETAPVKAPESLDSELADFDLELITETPEGGNEASTAESFLDKLVAEVEGLQTPAVEEVAPPKEKPKKKAPQEEPKPAAATSPEAQPAPPPPAPKPAHAPALVPKPATVVPRAPAVPKAPPRPLEPVVAHAEASASTPAPIGSTNELSDIFQEFRAELGEMSEKEEDLETHYNLGIAYREMGLLDEAIGEFQKVAKSVQEGRPFRYSMQCTTLLGLTFMDKQEPKIAALWYQRALEIPGLDQETILALRYDLGMAEEQAGNASAALDSFRQVYAMNIDYRDVAERIAALQKH